MGDPTRRDVIDAGLGDLGDSVERNAARRFERKAAADHVHRFAHGCRIHIVEQHRVGQSDVQHLARMLPATAMWLSLINMASSSPKRWLKPPPQRTAYFSSARRPGVVLRVQQMRARVPATRRTNSCVAVATPERRPSRLSAVRSAPSMARAGPVTVISSVLAATLEPSRILAAMSISGASLANVAATSGRPAITPAARATTMARADVSSGIVAVAVTSPARPRSSASARVTAASISSGDRKACGHRSERVMADADPQWNDGLSPPQKRVNIGRWNTRRCGKIYMKAAPLNT